MIEVVSPGLLTTVQDLGRPGWAHTGVPPSGAVDLCALDEGNGLVGNARSAAALEATLIGPTLRFRAAARVAVTGGVAESRVFDVAAGETVDVGRLERGARAYVCVRGGIDVPAVLGSRSTDLLSGLGPPPLRPGDRLAIGSDVGSFSPPPSSFASGPLRVVSGPRDDWFAPGELTAAEWTVTAASNRVGIRLAGPPLTRLRTDELLSEGLVTGALQVPPNGQPILLLNDHPTTGGYPVIAVVVTTDLPRAGQLTPGHKVRFALAS